jgi:thioredoxin-related protein
MKLFFLFFALTYALFAIDAKDAAFALDFEESYTVALEKAKQEDKLLMLVIVQDPCPYCEKLVEKTLSDPQVVSLLEKFVSVIVDKHGEFPQKFKTCLTPMCFFIDPQSEEDVWESPGYIEAKAFLEVLMEAQQMSDVTE